MPDLVETAILTALLSRAQAFATAQGITISMPNVAFTPPTPGSNAKWLKADFMPGSTAELGVSFNAGNQHGGIFQIGVFHGIGAGEPAPARIASAAISFFKRGSEFWKDGHRIQIIRSPYRGSIMIDGAWNTIPVTIPYVCFAPQT